MSSCPSASPGRARGLGDVTHLIWPESAFPFFLTREPDALAAIARMLPPTTVLITGAARARRARPRRPGLARLQFDLRDRPQRLDPLDLRQVASRPVRRILCRSRIFLERLGLMQLTKVPGRLSRRRPAPPDGGAAARRPMLPLICYEVIFPGEAVPRGRAAGLAPEPHQRRLVRHQFRALPALPAGPRARDRRGAAAGARRQ